MGRKLYGCSECNNSFTSSKIVTIGNVYVCKDCASRLYIRCASCNQIKKKVYSSTIKGFHYCAECMNGLYHTCVHCHTHTDLGDEFPTGWLIVSGNKVCDKCLVEKYAFCSNCSIHHQRDMLSILDCGSYCDTCYDSLFQDVVRDYTYKPTFNFHSLDNESTVHIGLEIELSCGSRDSRIMARNIKIFLMANGVSDTLFYFKRDGSVDNGFELNFQPMTLNFIRKNINLNKLFRYLSDMGVVANDSCGLHTHLTKSFFTIKELSKMEFFFNRAWDEILEFSGRTNMENVNAYCHKVESTVSGFKGHYVNGMIINIDRYACFNVNASPNSSEIRIFQGTTNYKEFLARVQFSDAVSNYIKDVSFTAISTNAWGSFTSWIKSNNRYSHLYEHLVYLELTEK